MIYVTGDCHADWSRFSLENFPDQKDMTREDFVIVLGDFGLWHDNPTERERLDWLSKKSFTLLFVDGNHENFDRLYGDEFPVVDFHGGRAHQIRENIYHLMRGYIFDLCGHSFFAFGGASSHDIPDGILDQADFASDEEFLKAYNEKKKRGELFRVNHLSWWRQELPSEEEMNRGIKNLYDHHNEVDFIISHCCPQSIAKLLLADRPDVLTGYFDKIALRVSFKRWFFGHYHLDGVVNPSYVVLYHLIVPIV